MPTIFYNPPLTQAYETFTKFPGGPHHHMIGRAHFLERLGWTPAASVESADIVHVTGVVNPPHRIDVLTLNAVWPVDLNPSAPQWWFEHNHLMQRAARRAKRVVVLSNYTAMKADTVMGIEPVVIPQAFNPEEWDRPLDTGWRQRYGIPGDAPVALWVKTVADWLRNPVPAVHLAVERPEVHVFMLAGYDNVAAYVGRVLPPNVHCVGILDFPVYQTLLAECDVFLSTTIEASGQAHLEAMYMGKPILAYDQGGISEVVGGAKPAGVLVPAGDIEAFVDAFADVWRKRKSFGTTGRKKAQAYTWEKVVPRYVELYERLLSDG